MSKKLLLLDVDCGVDDAQAIMMALAAPDVHILGIMCTHGNTNIENVCKNVLRVLKVCQRTEIDDKMAVVKRLNKNMPFSPFGLIDHAVSLVATGPLTNIALAFKMDRTFPSKLKHLYIMGGNMESRGNVAICSEFNFAADPEAAYIVLNHFACPMYIATWEYCLRHVLPWEFFKEWVNQGTEKACFMKKITTHSEKFAKDKQGDREMYFGPGFVSCDSFAVAAAIDESVVTEYIRYGVSVELQGSVTRGMMIVDTLNALQKENQAFIMTKCDVEKLKQLMMSALK
ncbi:pyrimidine-specific ribonucleoside hydrolase RihA-like [Chiloscyllium plagiosum]|uniref:pyrimidine-specific ribonucleoside hydrolase RihA-like n=1 Tax=Chiloscyllium plagiosum TaxID=36176 RepID=UPI001CB7E52A|nr:pyrimidine-specific ribonucleoside hydrolase RihA-like [Chiloscyllium plagiosum]